MLLYTTSPWSDGILDAFCNRAFLPMQTNLYQKIESRNQQLNFSRIFFLSCVSYHCQSLREERNQWHLICRAKQRAQNSASCHRLFSQQHKQPNKGLEIELCTLAGSVWLQVRDERLDSGHPRQALLPVPKDTREWRLGLWPRQAPRCSEEETLMAFLSWPQTRCGLVRADQYWLPGVFL